MNPVTIQALGLLWGIAPDALALALLLPVVRAVVRRSPSAATRTLLALATLGAALCAGQHWPWESAAAYARFAAMLGPSEAARGMVAVHGPAMCLGAAGRMLAVAALIAAVAIRCPVPLPVPDAA